MLNLAVLCFGISILYAVLSFAVLSFGIPILYVLRLLALARACDLLPSRKSW